MMLQNDVLDTARIEGRAEGRAAGLEEGRAAGLEEGRAEGLEEGKQAIARKMKERGMAIDVIAEMTELSPEEVGRL